jgi:hypothetical protein
MGQINAVRDRGGSLERSSVSLFGGAGVGLLEWFAGVGVIQSVCG